MVLSYHSKSSFLTFGPIKFGRDVVCAYHIPPCTDLHNGSFSCVCMKVCMYVCIDRYVSSEEAMRKKKREEEKGK